MSVLTSEFYFKRAKKYRKMGLHDSALRDYTTAIQLDSGNKKAYNNRGNIYYDREEYGKAIEDYSTAIALAPEAPTSYCGRGLCYEKLGDYSAALQDFTTAIDLNSSEFKYQYNRGNVWYALLEFDKAIEDYTSGICRNPDFAGAFYNRGMANKQLRKYELAIVDFSEAIRLKPDHAYALFNRADTWSLLYLFGEARNDYEMGLSYSGDDEFARQCFEQCLEKIRHYARDAARYTERIKNNPEMPEHYFGRGLCNYYQGQYADACNDFKHLADKYGDDELCGRYMRDCIKKMNYNEVTNPDTEDMTC